MACGSALEISDQLLAGTILDQARVEGRVRLKFLASPVSCQEMFVPLLGHGKRIVRNTLA